MPPAALQTHGTGCDLDLIMRNDDVLGCDLIELRSFDDAETASVHVGVGLQKHDRPTPKMRCCTRSIKGRGRQSHARDLRQIRHQIATDVVTCAVVFRAWVSQANNEYSAVIKLTHGSLLSVLVPRRSEEHTSELQSRGHL